MDYKENRSRELTRSFYDHKLMIESEHLVSVAYEIKNRYLSIMTFQNGNKYILRDKIPKMRDMANEIIQICDYWEDIRT